MTFRQESRVGPKGTGPKGTKARVDPKGKAPPKRPPWFFWGAPVLIGTFAWIYFDVGLIESSTQCHVQVSVVDAIYFSVVTWTTLGYGEVLPTSSIRSFAAAEAFLGYIYMAVAIGLTVSLLDKRMKSGPPNN